MDFAPVLDLAFEASRSVMGSRAVSADPLETVTYAREFLAGLGDAKVLGCGKHFPGLGEGNLDSHHELPVIEKPLKELWAEDLLPYRTLRRQLPMVMISHAAYPQVTHDRTPASLSKRWITDILRKRIGYRNLIVSDDLEMGGVLSAAPIGEAAVGFVRAGGDLVLGLPSRGLRSPGIRRADQNGGTRLKIRAKSAGVRQARAGIQTRNAERICGLAKAPSPATIEKLTRRLWEFGEQVRLEPFGRRADKRRARS